MKLAVFLASKNGNDPIYQEKIIELGQWIGTKDHELVYGGTHTGLMGVLSDEVKKWGGHITGVGVEVLSIHKVLRNDLDELYMTKDMNERKKKMMELADGFLIFPGSFGTLDELTDVLSALKLKQFSKPAVILNIGGFYDELEVLFRKMVSCGFMEEEALENVHFVKDVSELDTLFAAY